MKRMSMRVLCVSLVSVAFLLGSGSSHADTLSGTTLVKALQGGGYVLVMRHANSPQEKPDKAAAEPDNTRMERQLSADGKATAAAMGAAIKKLNIPMGEILVSPTYRALQTVKLAGLSAPMPSEMLSDGGLSMQTAADDRRSGWLRDRVAMPPAAKTNRLLVTHLPNIAGAFGDQAKDAGDGEALVFHPGGKGAAPLVARIKIDDWPKLAAEK